MNVQSGIRDLFHGNFGGPSKDLAWDYSATTHAKAEHPQ